MGSVGIMLYRSGKCIKNIGEGRRPLERTGCRQEGNIKMELKVRVKYFSCLCMLAWHIKRQVYLFCF